MTDEAAQPPPAPRDKTLESWNPITVVVLATQAAVRAVVTVPLWREVSTLYRATRPARSIWVVPGVIVAALALLALFSPAREAPWPLVGHQAKAWVLTTAAAGGVGVPAIFGICLVQDRVRRHRPETMTTSDVEVALSSGAQMRRFLGTAGAVIGLAVLASGALRLATVPEYLDESAFPATAVLLYGAFFTGLLVLVDVPAHLSLRRFCVDIREQYFPVEGMPPPTSPGRRVHPRPPRVRRAGCHGAAGCMRQEAMTTPPLREG